MTARKPALIFDGDDTLWQTQPIYKSVLDEFYQLLEHEGFDPQEARRVFTEINQSLLEAMQMSTGRLSRAMSSTYAALLHQRGSKSGGRVHSRAALSAELERLAGEVYTRLPEPMQDVHAALSMLAKDFDLYLYSGGKDSTQRYRLLHLGLAPYFEDRVAVVTTKDDNALQHLLANNNLTPAATWIVGNSPRFEINPGLRLGLHAIWMCTSFWQQDLEDIGVERTFVAFSLTEVADVLHREVPMYRRRQRKGALVQSETGALAQSPENRDMGETWVVGTSPKQHINPALRRGFIPIWIPMGFASNEVEPICGSVFVAFSPDGARNIINQWSNSRDEPPKVVWEAQESGDERGGGIVVE